MNEIKVSKPKTEEEHKRIPKLISAEELRELYNAKLKELDDSIKDVLIQKAEAQIKINKYVTDVEEKYKTILAEFDKYRTDAIFKEKLNEAVRQNLDTKVLEFKEHAQTRLSEEFKNLSNKFFDQTSEIDKIYKKAEDTLEKIKEIKTKCVDAANTVLDSRIKQYEEELGKNIKKLESEPKPEQAFSYSPIKVLEDMSEEELYATFKDPGYVLKSDGKTTSKQFYQALAGEFEIELLDTDVCAAFEAFVKNMSKDSASKVIELAKQKTKSGDLDQNTAETVWTAPVYYLKYLHK